MNRHDKGWKDCLRLRYGLHWQSKAPTLADYPQTKTYAIRLVLVFALWGWAMDRDYRAISEAKAASDVKTLEQQLASAREDLLACMNGKPTSLFYLDSKGNHIRLVCDKAWELNAGKEE